MVSVPRELLQKVETWRWQAASSSIFRPSRPLSSSFSFLFNSPCLLAYMKSSLLPCFPISSADLSFSTTRLSTRRQHTVPSIWCPGSGDPANYSAAEYDRTLRKSDPHLGCHFERRYLALVSCEYVPSRDLLKGVSYMLFWFGGVIRVGLETMIRSHNRRHFYKQLYLTPTGLGVGG